MSTTQRIGPVIGIDFGASKITVGIVNNRGVVRNTFTTPTQGDRGARHVIDTIRTLIARTDPNDHCRAIGIGAPGYVDPKKGIVHTLPNVPHWKNVPLKHIIEKNFKKKVTIENDAKCFALAEYYFGIGAHTRLRSLAAVTVGSGVGCGIIIDGHLLRGRNNLAGELGQTVILLERSKQIRLDVLGSGHAFERAYKRRTGRHLAAEKIELKYTKGDRAAYASRKETAFSLGIGLANLVHLFNPQCVVLGGGFADHKGLLPDLRRYMQAALRYQVLKNTPVVLSSIRGTAGILGAALATGRLIRSTYINMNNAK